MAAVAVDELGPNCSKNGITSLMLLSYVSTESCVRLPEVQTITNKLVFKLSRFKDRHSQCTFKTLHEWIRALHGSMWPQEQPPICQAFSKSIEWLTARLSKLKKQHSTAKKDEIISGFLQQEYVLPKLGFYKGRVLHFSPAKKPTCAKQSVNDTDTQIQKLKQKVYAVTQNTNKRLKRREKVIDEQKSQIHRQQEAIKTYEKKLKGAESQLSKLRAQLELTIVHHTGE